MDLPVDTFLESLRANGDISEKTVEAYGGDLARFAKFIQSELQRPPKVADFTAGMLKTFLQQESKAGRGMATLLRRRATLRRMRDYLEDQGLIDGDLSTKILIKPPNRPFRGSAAREPEFLGEDDIERLYKALEKRKTPRSLRDQAIIRVLLETGITIGTLVSIDLEHFEWDKGGILVKPDGFDKAYWLPLAAAIPPIEVYLREGRPNLTDSRIERAMFVSQMGGRISRQSVWQSLQNWGRRAKIKAGLTPSVIRHTAVKHMYAHNVPVSQIQHSLGHRNVLSTHALLRRLQIKSSK